MFAGRSLGQTVRALGARQHYIAFWNMFRNYTSPLDCLRRYLLGTGSYPYRVTVRTPTKPVSPLLHTHHDLLTVNEIFCRQDYSADDSLRVVVDIGSNIGISALYFLSRNDASKCYLYEPDQRNIGRLRQNLTGFESRFVLHQVAVSSETGRVRFGIEATGRYGGIGKETGEYIDVECISINDVLHEVLSHEDSIDILKLDTEGAEIDTVRSISSDLLPRIGKIYMEAEPRFDLHPALFNQEQYGSVCRLTNKRVQ